MNYSTKFRQIAYKLLEHEYGFSEEMSPRKYKKYQVLIFYIHENRNKNLRPMGILEFIECRNIMFEYFRNGGRK